MYFSFLTFQSVAFTCDACVVMKPTVSQGSARRKKKVLHKTTVGDDKKLQTSLKKLGLNPIPSIEEVCLYLLF